MINVNKPLSLPPQLHWKYAHEPELLGWTIRARNYNTFVANCMFVFMSFVAMGMTYMLYTPPRVGENYLPEILTRLGFYVLMSFVLLSMTHQKMNFAYRFTRSGVECCEWKDFPKWVLTFLKWFAGIMAIVFVFLATLDPAFLIGALVGPGSMGLVYFSMAHSKGYQDMQTQYHHLMYAWKDFTQLAIANNREVVDLQFVYFNPRLGRVIYGSQNIFCKRKQKEDVASFIKPYLTPDIPFIRAKVEVPMSTD